MMPSSNEVGEVLARVEGATKGSQELDALIACALLAPAGSKVEQSPFNGVWCIYEPRRYGKEPFGLWEGHGVPPELKRGAFTASIDAAIALVERKLPGMTAGMIPRFYKDKPWAGIITPSDKAVDLKEAMIVGGATPALSIIAALLRALANQETDRDANV